VGTRRSYRMRREEDQVMAEHASPNDSCQLSLSVSITSLLLNNISVYIQSMRLPALQHRCLRPWSVTVRSDGGVSRKYLTYLSRSCGTEAVLPAGMHHPSFREEVPPRWYQALGVLLGQPSFGLGLKLGNDPVKRVGFKQLCLENAAVYEEARWKPTHSLPFSYTFALFPRSITVAGIHLSLVHYATFAQMTRWDQCSLRLSQLFVLSS